MTSQSKPASKWGLLLQQAVAGVESRLDTILADGTGDGDRSIVEEARITSGQSSNESQSRDSRTKDSKATITPNGRTFSPTIPPTIRQQDDVLRAPSPLLQVRRLEAKDSLADALSRDEPKFANEKAADSTTPRSRINDTESNTHNLNHENREGAPQEPGVSAGRKATNDLFGSSESGEESLLAEDMRMENRILLERIDHLQAKLYYYMSESSIAAKSVLETSAPTSFENRIASKDQKIALLMEEGQKLSNTEARQSAVIKRLRSNEIEQEKAFALQKIVLDKTKETCENLEQKLKIKEAESIKLEGQIELAEKLMADVEKSNAQLAEQTSQATNLQNQLNHFREFGIGEQTQKFKSLLEAERADKDRLQAQLSDTKSECHLKEENYKTHIRSLQDAVTREQESSRAIEIDLKGEIQILESRLEVFTTRAEAIASGGNDKAHLQLNRQVEVLQASYSTASENWKKIETSLISRLSNSQRERDVLSKREAELRRKLRDSTSRCRRLEIHLEHRAVSLRDTEEALNKTLEKSSCTMATLRSVESERDELKADLNSTRELLESKLAQLRLELKRDPKHAIPAQSRGISLASLPSASKSGLALSIQPGNNTKGEYMTAMEGKDSPTLKKVLPPDSSRTYFGDSLEPASSLVHNLNFVDASELPPSNLSISEEVLDRLPTPATPEKTVNGALSVSTTTAGPSVQLLERMSAAVRRLESEKATLQDELDQLIVQRDEERDQVVSLMRELGEKRDSDERVSILEKELTELKSRHSTTLEMLGEKSELVEELRADISDMKDIYRSTLEKAVGE